MIGCGDSIVATTTGLVIYTDRVEAAISSLLDTKDAHLGQSGLVNSLADSNLSYVSSSVSSGTVTVELTGELRSGGICDNPRIIAQLEYTAMMAADVPQAKILVNGKEIAFRLSGK
ncbi:GerMN domain-containing protein [Paeniglutamicibacter sp. Y32M11]|nr:GerMN domain-containing protein [Paeniglutamicibacter sp. Y32M11]